MGLCFATAGETGSVTRAMGFVATAGTVGVVRVGADTMVTGLATCGECPLDEICTSVIGVTNLIGDVVTEDGVGGC